MMTPEAFFQHTSELLKNREFEKIKTLHAQYVEKTNSISTANPNFISSPFRIFSLERAILDLIEKSSSLSSEQGQIKDKENKNIFSYLSMHMHFTNAFINQLITHCLNSKRDDYLKLFIESCEISPQPLELQSSNIVATAYFSHKDSYYVLKNYFHQKNIMIMMDSFAVTSQAFNQPVDESLYIDLYYSEKKRSKELPAEELTYFSTQMKINIARFFRQELHEYQSLKGWEALQDFFIHCEEMTAHSTLDGNYTLLVQAMELRKDNPAVFTSVVTDIMLDLMEKDTDFFNHIDLIIHQNDKNLVSLTALNKKLTQNLGQYSSLDDESNLKNKI